MKLTPKGPGMKSQRLGSSGGSGGEQVNKSDPKANPVILLALSYEDRNKLNNLASAAVAGEDFAYPARWSSNAETDS